MKGTAWIRERDDFLQGLEEMVLVRERCNFYQALGEKEQSCDRRVPFRLLDEAVWRGQSYVLDLQVLKVSEPEVYSRNWEW